VTTNTKEPAAYPAAVQCQHHVCRCARAAELAAMGMTPEAIAVHERTVTCRMPGQHAAPVARPTVDSEDG
jgi:hypothetical protein